MVRALLLVTLAAVAWTVLWSPLLRVRDVRLVGAEHVTAADVARVSDLSEDDNLLFVSTDAVAERVEALPWVRSASVDRRLLGTVRVKVTERRPALTLSLGAAKWTIDVAGRVLAAGESGAGLPVLGGASVGDIEPGARVRGPEVTDALRAFRSMPPRLAHSVEAVFAPTLERISFAFASGPLVRYGAAEHLAAKHRVLVALLRRIEAEGSTAAYIDIRVPTSPAVSPVVPTAEDATAPAPPQ